MKNISLFLIVSIFSNFSNAEDYNMETNVEKVMSYAANSEYTANQCLIFLGENLPSKRCQQKSFGVVYLKNEAGNMMCTLGLTAYLSQKKIVVASHDDCDTIHSAPILRWVIIKD
ncbi:hypothetical protein A3759_03515 [Thalassolituus sp. HI0120]|nr:hypothetical protein A3759_03515 [Thalassolituus sp. HI0120]